MTPHGRQLSLFGVEAASPAPLDLEGLLAGEGQVSRMGGTARVSVVVNDRWRVAALLEEFRLRGLAATCESTQVDGSLRVLTAYSTALAEVGARWLRGTVKTVPKKFVLDGQRLRLWTAASGAPDGRRAYALRLGPGDGDPIWRSVGSALASVGLPSLFLGQQAGGPAYRIVGRRRLDRLVELVGEAPSAAPPGHWPG
jgi:hypothetical protein